MFPKSRESANLSKPKKNLSKKALASFRSIQPRSMGSIPLNSVDQVVTISFVVATLGSGLGTAAGWEGGVIPLKLVAPGVNLSSGECELAAVLASISKGCPKLDPNPASVEVGTPTVAGCVPSKDFRIDANVFSNSSNRLNHAQRQFLIHRTSTRNAFQRNAGNLLIRVFLSSFIRLISICTFLVLR